MAASAPAPSACPSETEIDALRSLAPEAIPAPLALHLAGCESCQRRLLFGAATRARRTRRPPSLERALLLAGILIAALVLALLSVCRLAATLG